MNRTLLLAILVAALFVPVGADRDAEIVTVPIEREVIQQPKCEPKQTIESNPKRPVRNLFKRLRNR